MLKLFLAPVFIALLLHLFYTFYTFSTPEEKSSYVRGAFKGILFLSLACLLLTVFVILPNAAILQSATDLVASQNALKVKENEIRIAEAEARRMQMLTANAGQSIAYMSAQSLSMIAEGVKNGKVNSVVIPFDFKGIVNVK